MPKVSVIVPIYNNEKYLEQCLNSICSQTLEDIEIILVNDGSTDSSPAICDKFAQKDNRIKVIHKENAGLGVA
jgi:glycosyltransferase involved in cell wall biosynthesis